MTGRAPGPGGRASVATAPQGSGGAIGMTGRAPRGGPPLGGNLAARGGSNWQGGGNWRGGNWQHPRRHHRGPFITYGFGAPYFYDYAIPYSYYGDDGCWAYRFVRGAYRRVWVCY